MRQKSIRKSDIYANLRDLRAETRALQQELEKHDIEGAVMVAEYLRTLATETMDQIKDYDEQEEARTDRRSDS